MKTITNLIYSLFSIGLISFTMIANNAFGESADKQSETDTENTAGNAHLDAAKLQKATFGAGCFWGVEAAFRQLKGVKATRVGYEGGTTTNPTYKEVCTDNTGHAEVVEVTYDPAQISYEKLLSVFFENHDPTQLNRQGPDFGTQYRTVIFYNTEQQKAEAIAAKDALQASGKLRKPVATQIVKATTFYVAEDYHQQYLEKRGLSKCHIN